MTRRAVVPFAVIVALLFAALGADIWYRRPHEVPAPPYADSLKGVVVRVGGCGDSTRVITYWQSPDRWLGMRWISSAPYRYRDSSLTGDVPIVGEADIARRRITVAAHQMTPALVKHEMVHVLCRIDGHPAELFSRVESYHDR